jgi:hypothetical protein
MTTSPSRNDWATGSVRLHKADVFTSTDTIYDHKQEDKHLRRTVRTSPRMLSEGEDVRFYKDKTFKGIGEFSALEDKSLDDWFTDMVKLAKEIDKLLPPKP